MFVRFLIATLLLAIGSKLSPRAQVFMPSGSIGYLTGYGVVVSNGSHASSLRQHAF
jgi:hypothetical protein